MVAALWMVNSSGSVCSPIHPLVSSWWGSGGEGAGGRSDGQGPCSGGARELEGGEESRSGRDRRWEETREGWQFFGGEYSGSRDRQQQREALQGYSASSFPDRVHGYAHHQSMKGGHEDQESGKSVGKNGGDRKVMTERLAVRAEGANPPRQPRHEAEGDQENRGRPFLGDFFLRGRGVCLRSRGREFSPYKTEGWEESGAVQRHPQQDGAPVCVALPAGTHRTEVGREGCAGRVCRGGG